MIKKILTFCFLVIVSTGISQNYFTKELSSSSLEMKRTLRISLPSSYQSDSLKTYPLAIVLNGEYLFDIYYGNAKLFADKEKAPEQIIVGINMQESYNNDIGFDRNTGELLNSAKRFYLFLRDEVIFHMQSNYRITPFLSIVGEGYAANLISHFLGEQDAFVNAFVMVNPNFSEFIGNQLYDYNLSRLAKADNIFYLYTNNNSKFSTKKQAIIANVQDGLASLNMDNVKVINDQINTKFSLSSISAAIPKAIYKIFEIFAPITKEEYDKNIKDLSPDQAIEYLRNKYYDIDYLFGIKMDIREGDIAAIEGIVMDKENGDKLKDFGKLFLDLRPESPLGDYYIGMYYELGEDLKKALKYYRQGYSKMDPANPKADAFYENILRVGGE